MIEQSICFDWSRRFWSIYGRSLRCQWYVTVRKVFTIGKYLGQRNLVSSTLWQCGHGRASATEPIDSMCWFSPVCEIMDSFVCVYVCVLFILGKAVRERTISWISQIFTYCGWTWNITSAMGSAKGIAVLKFSLASALSQASVAHFPITIQPVVCNSIFIEAL